MLIRTMLGLILTALLAFAVVQPASADIPRPPDAPDPTPVAGCEWYGELTESIRMEYRNTTLGSQQDRVIDKAFSSQESDGEGCAAFYSEYYYDSFLDLEETYCDPTPIGGDEYPVQIYYSVVLEGATSGIGGLAISLNGNPDAPEILAHGIGAPYEITNTTEGLLPCGEISTDTTTTTSAGVNSELGYSEVCDAETAVPDLLVQAVAGSCEVTTVTDHGPGASTTETTVWTWKFKRAVCDATVDSDRGGVGDCAEYEQGTNPDDPTDDFAPDSDGDGVPDQQDQCEGTPAGTPVDANGCTPDADADGVPDQADQCSGTPLGAVVDVNGCSVDTDGDGVPDGIDQCSATPQEVSVDASGCPVDSDGDGVTDDIDGCPGTPPGTPVDTAGCSGGSDDCIGEVDARGYTVAHYDADIELIAAPDPDFFDWDVSANWCVSNDRIYIGDVDSLGLVTLDTAVAGTLDLAGFTFRHDAEDDAAFVTPVGGTTTGSVMASTDFEVCANPAVLLLDVAGGKLSELFLSAASSTLGKLPKAGDAASWMDDMSIRLDEATLGVDAKLLDWFGRAADPKRLGRMINIPIAEKLWSAASDAINARSSALSLAVTGVDTTNSLHEMADKGFQRFLDVYGDGETILVPRKDQKAAREFWNQIVADTALEMTNYLMEKIDSLTMCGTVWRPVLTIYIPQTGESFVDESLIDNSIFDVKGGISVDTRG